MISNYDKFLLPQKTVYCNHCGLIQSNPRMNDKSLEYYYSNEFYRSIYTDTESNFENHKSQNHIRPGSKKILEFH